MASVEIVTQEALALPASGRVLLVEKLLASLEGKIDPTVERATLNDVRERRQAIKAGKAKLRDGASALKTVRAGVSE